MRRRCWRCCGACGRSRTQLPAPPAPGLTSFADDERAATRFCMPRAFAVIGRPRHPLRHAGAAGRRTGKGAATGTDAETSAAQAGVAAGRGNDEARAVLAALGWRMRRGRGCASRSGARRKEKRRPRARQAERRKPPPIPDSPFAGLARAASREMSDATRIDKWLFHARFYRTRALAQAAAECRQGAAERGPGGKAGPGAQARRCPHPGPRRARSWRSGCWPWPSGAGLRREAQTLYEIVAD